MDITFNLGWDKFHYVIKISRVNYGYPFKAGQINKAGLLIPGALSPSSA
jgi:hypothetical protein